jgi:hypothetical protein
LELSTKTPKVLEEMAKTEPAKLEALIKAQFGSASPMTEKR